jgi:hypothetical protein
MGKPTRFFFREWLGVTTVDTLVDFSKLSDIMSDFETNIFAHMKITGVSSKFQLTRKLLPRTPLPSFKTSIAISSNQTAFNYNLKLCRRFLALL